MRFESCLAVLLTALVVLAGGSNDDDDNKPHILAFDGEILHPMHRQDKKNSSDDAIEKRSKRFLFDSERDAILYNFNYRRGLVGSSDMNYLDYSIALEADLSSWTSRCNFDAGISTSYKGYASKAFSEYSPNHAKEIGFLISSTSSFYAAATSIYVTGVAGSVDYCSKLTFNGTIYNRYYLFVYGLLTPSGLFNETVQQYTLGPACTQCQSNVSWCYNNLCRDDCSLSLFGCCQISNSSKTEVCATTTTSTTTTSTTTVTTTTEFNYYKSGASGIQAIGTAVLHGLLLIICYHFQ